MNFYNKHIKYVISDTIMPIALKHMKHEERDLSDEEPVTGSTPAFHHLSLRLIFGETPCFIL
ncbi:hypothetical protein RBIBE_18260 [Bacillus velezensis]|nr:hypothetical protein RBIBE_18260 [Bacillus velezensis]